jgi:glucose/arabinose dehydrogenase
VVSHMRVVGSGAEVRFDAPSEQVVLRLEQPFGNHNGGMIAFGPDGSLYVGFGDGGGAGDPLKSAQDPASWLGSLLRLDVSAPGGYTVPEDNPFVEDERGSPEVWALGLRNPWRFSFDRKTGDLWIADVGQNRWEEVNHVPVGEGAGWNFGWPRYEGDERYSDAALFDAEPVFPVAVYGIRGQPHCAVTGGYVYRGQEVPALEGVYLFSDWCSGVVWGLQERDGAWDVGKILETSLRPSSFAEDASGELYLVDHGGSIHRFVAMEASETSH